jgi:hypothetical protein
MVRETGLSLQTLRAIVGCQATGRPLRASEAQQAQVRKLRVVVKTVRQIAHETNLSFQTIRTIIARKHDLNRTTKRTNHLEKIGLKSPAHDLFARAHSRTGFGRRLGRGILGGRVRLALMDDRRGGQPGGDQLQDRDCELWLSLSMRHSAIATVRSRGSDPLVPGLGLRLRRAVSRDRLVLAERCRTIETLFTVFLHQNCISNFW